MVLSIVDNGSGFSYSQKNRFAKGLGLSTMQERAKLLGGELHSHSAKNKGTKIVVNVPVKLKV